MSKYAAVQYYVICGGDKHNCILNIGGLVEDESDRRPR